MKTPAGKECQYFFGDYYRGREHEECRLLNSQNPPLAWRSELCFTCPVPEILLANACPYLEYWPQLIRPFPFLKQQVKINAYCNKVNQEMAEPEVGCGQCHPLPFVLPGDDVDPHSTP